MAVSKIRVFCNDGSGYGRREEIIDLEQDWGITPDEWADMSRNEKKTYVDDWAWNYLEIGHVPVED